MGHIRIADQDIVEMSNMNRQIFTNRETLVSKSLDSEILKLIILTCHGVAVANVPRPIVGSSFWK